ncbi:AAA family ATPase [Paenibacillus sp. M1]|uniref:AAA family ATPase n=1 Tax=Paenibacillus haidiansis TaxID=1574488 RepID=A0ABU7VP21_9BACL
MRIEKLKVSGFGHLHGLEVELDAPVTVLFGPNEAGKSTLLGFVRAMLFGIPSRVHGPQRYEPVHGGPHGGSIALRGEDGSQWLIERYGQPPEGSGSGGKGELLRIARTGPDGQIETLSQDDLQRELLGGMSKEMFQQLFAVSLTELQEVSALQSEEMSAFLFHAGIGGGTAVLRGEKKLVQEMDKLYRPRGRNQEVAQQVQAVERLEREAGAAKALLPRYREVLGELERVDAGLAEAEAELARRGREASLTRKAADNRADWLKREALRIELAALPERAPFPEQGLSRWEALQAEKERLRLEAGELARKIDALHKELEALAPNRDLLEREAALRALAERLPGYERRLQELVELEAETKQLGGKLGQCLRSIHQDWTAETLRDFAGTVGERESIRQYMGRFHTYDKEMDLLNNERFKLEREVSALKAAENGAVRRLTESAGTAGTEFAQLVPRDREEIRKLWSEISTLLDRWRAAASARQDERRAAQAEAAASERIDQLYRRLLGGGAALTVLLPAALWLTTKSGWGTLLAAAVLLGFDVFLASGLLKGSRNAANRRARGRRAMPSAAPGSAEEARLQELLPRLVAHPLTAAGSAAGAAARTVPPEPERWDEEERALRRLMESWMLWDQRHEDLAAQAEECRLKTAGALRELDSLERELSRKDEQFAGLAREWEDWLRVRRLPGDLSPEAAMDVFRLAEQGCDWLGRLDALSAKTAAAREAADAFERDCRREGLLGEAEGAASSGERQSAAAGLRKALAELDVQLDLKARRERLRDKLIPLEEELGRTRDRLDAVTDAERHLLEESGAADGEAYLRHGAEAERRRLLEAELRQIELVLFGAIGGEHRPEVEELLRGREEEELARLAEAARVRLEDAERARQRLQEARGRLLQEQESLEARGLQEDLQQQLAERQAALEETVDRYAVMAVTRELIARVRKIYEEERQPEVLKAASGYLEEMTGGVYRRILVKMGSQELMAEHRDHGPISSSFLSRGTAEQLYLAMRLALSDAVAGRVGMPILLDDLFVNFDAARLAGALSVLKRVADKHQIIMMTCHAHVMEGVKARFPEAATITMR